jgi:very-short-patch-repair endonuclease
MHPAESKNYSFIGRRKYKTRLRRRLKRNKTHAEALLLAFVRKIGARHTFQKIVRGYIVDFYFHKGKLAVELDGDSHIGKEDYDAERTEHIAKEGIEVMRFRNEEVIADVAAVWEKIQKRCKERRAEKVLELQPWEIGKYCCPHCGKELPENL